MDLAQLYEAFDTDARPTVEFLEWIVSRHGIRTPPAVLDVGCGPGRFLTPLSTLGWQVVGLEPDPTYRARAQDVAEFVGATVHDGGFTEIEGSAAFDLILGINSSFAHLLTPEDRADALRRCRRALRQDGALILDLPNLLRILREYREPKDQKTERDGRRITLKRRHTIDYVAATFATHEKYLVTEPDGTIWSAEKDHLYSIMTLPDLIYLLDQAGFGQIEVYGSMADRNTGRVDTRMIIVAAVT